MEQPNNPDNVEYLRPINPELIVIWKGLEVVITNTRMTKQQVLDLLDTIDDKPTAA